MNKLTPAQMVNDFCEKVLGLKSPTPEMAKALSEFEDAYHGADADAIYRKMQEGKASDFEQNFVNGDDQWGDDEVVEETPMWSLYGWSCKHQGEEWWFEPTKEEDAGEPRRHWNLWRGTEQEVIAKIRSLRDRYLTLPRK